jgi:phosphatidylserine decarboxylase
MDIIYVDRKTKRLERELVAGRRALSFFYGDSWVSKVAFYLLLPLVACGSWLSRFYGWIQKTKWSEKKIAPFIERYQVDSSEFLDDRFENFNDFFIRKLKPEVRRIAPGKDVLGLPADGRYLMFLDVFESDHFYIKGHRFCLASLLQDEGLANHFQHGSMVLARLCPSDYHRFHFPCDGKIEEIRPISGPLYSVNPMALKKKRDILIQNKRVLTLLQSDHFGLIAYVEIGATFVGSIHQTCKVGDIVKKGEEKGYFSFGGSCIALLFEPGHVILDEDFVFNSSRGWETKAFFGEKFGVHC